MAGGLGGGDKLVLINPLANPPTSLPVKIMRLDGKLMGQLVPDTTVVTSTTYTGCRGRRPCLENCSYSLANRKLIHNSVTLTVSGIADSVCTATRSQFGGSLSTTITHSGFAAMNGAYFLSMVDACWPVNDTTFPGSPLESYVTKWTFNPTIRYQSTQTGGSNPFSFDVTCTLQVEIIVGRSDTADNAFFGVDLDLIAFPLSPSRGASDPVSIWGMQHLAQWKCRINEGASDVATKSSWCEEYPACYRGLFGNNTAPLAVNLFGCCPFTGMTVTPSWSTV